MRAAALAAVLALAGCAGFGSESAIKPAAQPDPGSATCHAAGYVAPSILILAKEAVSEELDGLNYFASDWGRRQGCFRATVVTAASALEPGPYRAMIIDVSHDQSLGADDIGLARRFLAAGKRLAVFGWPLRLADLSFIQDSMGGLPVELGDFVLSRAAGCGDWQYSDAPKAPFLLAATSYRYENFGSSIFTVQAKGPQRPWASALFCPTHPGPVMVEVPAGIIAGFSVSYTVSLADNNVRAVAMKRLLVDVMTELSAPSPVLA